MDVTSALGNSLTNTRTGPVVCTAKCLGSCSAGITAGGVLRPKTDRINAPPNPSGGISNGSPTRKWNASPIAPVKH